MRQTEHQRMLAEAAANATHSNERLYNICNKFQIKAVLEKCFISQISMLTKRTSLFLVTGHALQSWQDSHTEQFICHMRVDMAHSPCIQKPLGMLMMHSSRGRCLLMPLPQANWPSASLLQGGTLLQDRTLLLKSGWVQSAAPPSTHKLEAREEGWNSVQCKRQRHWRTGGLRPRLELAVHHQCLSVSPWFVCLLLHLTPSFATTPTLALFYLISLSHPQFCSSVIVLLDIC